MRNTPREFVPLLLKALFCIVCLYLLSAIPFAWIISHEPKEGVPYLSLFARMIRFAIGVIICVAMRNANKDVLRCLVGRRKGILVAILLCAAVVYYLNMSGAGDKFFYFISDIVRIRSEEGTPFFILVLWEQIFSIDFLMCILAGLAIFTFPVRSKG